MNILRSCIVSFVLLSVLSMSILPVSAYVSYLNLFPWVSQNDASPGYLGVMNFVSNDNSQYRYLNLTIPAGYELVNLDPDSVMGTFTISEKVKIRMISKNDDKVKFQYSIDEGKNYIEIPGNLSINGGSITDQTQTNTLTFNNPTTDQPGFVEFKLGTLGPVNSLNYFTVEMTKGTVKNPSTPGQYYWEAKAKVSETDNSPTSGGTQVTIT